MIPEKIASMLKKQHYGIVGKHSALQICLWTKKSLLDKGFCYKQKFYGIKSHECCQISCATVFCHCRCLHCWRPIEFTLGRITKKQADEPKKIIEGCIKEQRRLLSGFKGAKQINIKKFYEAQEPKHFAISLAGEPTIYPYIAELILELKKRKKTSFLVSNGLMPSRLEELQKKDALPSQLYVSMNAPNSKLHEKICRPLVKNAWERYKKTLSLLPKLETRRVIRLTLVKDLNMLDHEGYARLIKKAMPDFVEVKSYMSIGFARARLGYERMPFHSEIRRFTEKLSLLTKMPILDEKKESRVVLLGKEKSFI